jgi:hypothetical protein
MTKTSKDWTKVLIKFQTASIIPAPYSYYYLLELNNLEKEVGVNLTLSYLDREELDEESILDEGFTLHDDYTWKGELPQVWLAELEKMLGKDSLTVKDKISETDNFIEVEITQKESEKVVLYPIDREKWDYFLQEIIQSVYEVSKKELPFELEYLSIGQKKTMNILLKASFSIRTFTIKSGENEPTVVSWKWVNEVMSTVFRAEFLMEEALEAIPKQPGTYLAIGDGLWYPMYTAIVEPTNKSKVLPKIDALFKDLFEQSS